MLCMYVCMCCKYVRGNTSRGRDKSICHIILQGEACTDGLGVRQIPFSRTFAFVLVAFDGSPVGIICCEAAKWGFPLG
jgi:hypothetical protein